MKKLVLVGIFWGVFTYTVPEFLESRESEYHREQERQTEEKLSELKEQNIAKQQEIARLAEMHDTALREPLESPKVIPQVEHVTPVVKLPVTPEVPKQSGIAVKAIESHKQTMPSSPVKQQTLSSWLSEWNKFSYKPSAIKSVFGTQAGELYRLPMGARAQALLEFVKAVPEGFFAEPAKGLDALSKVLKEANSALEGSSNKAEQIEALREAVLSKATQVIENGTFGKTPLQALDSLSFEKIGNNIPADIQAIPGAYHELQKAALERTAAVVAESDAVTTPTTEELVKLVTKFNENFQKVPDNIKSPELEDKVTKAIENKVADFLTHKGLSGNTPELQAKDLLNTFFSLRDKNLGLTDKNWVEIQNTFTKRASKLLSESTNPSSVLNALIPLAPQLKKLSSNEQVQLVTAMGTLVSKNILGSHDISFSGAVQQYQKELTVLSKYLTLAQGTDLGTHITNNESALGKVFLQNAQRALLIIEFLEQRKEFLPTNEQSAIASSIDRFKRTFFRKNEAPFNLAERDPNFFETYQTIKIDNLFKQPNMDALPTDLVGIGDALLSEFTRTQDPEVRKKLLERLYVLREAVSNDYIGMRTPKVAQFVAKVDIVDAQTFEKMSRVETSVEDALSAFTDPTNTEQQAALEKKLGQLLEDIQEASSSIEFEKNKLALERFEEVQKYVLTGYALLELAQNYKRLLAPEVSQIKLNDVYAQFADAALVVTKYIDYRNTEPFKAQLDRMTKQQQALELLNKIIEQPFVTTDDNSYSLRQLNTHVGDWLARGKLPTPEAIAALEQAGFIIQDEQRYKLTSRGASLSIIAQEGDLVAQRVEQLSKFIDTYKASSKAPEWNTVVANPEARRAYKLIEDLQLPKLILDDQIIALRNYYQENIYNPTRAIVPLNKEQLEDLVAVLDILNQRNAGKPVDRALEIFLEYKLEKPDETPNVEKILELRATGNTRLALEVTPMTLRQGIGSLTNQMGSRINELYAYVSLETQKKLTQARQKGSFVGKVGSVVAGIWGYATLKRVFGGSGLGSFSLPYVGAIGDAVSLAGGALLGAGLWKLVSGIEPTTEELKALNVELETHGVRPIKIGESWRAQAKAWVKEFVQTDFQKAVDLLGNQQAYVQERTAIFEKAKTTLYQMLNLPATAKADEVIAAVDKLNASGGLLESAANLLKRQRVSNQVNILVNAAQQMSQAYLDEVTTLNELGLRAVNNSASSNTNIFINVLPEFIQKALESTSDEKTKIAPQEARNFIEVQSMLEHFYGQQVADLEALNEFIATAKDPFKAATVLGPTNALKIIQDTLTGRIQTVQNEFYAGLVTVLKGTGHEVSLAGNA